MNAIAHQSMGLPLPSRAATMQDAGWHAQQRPFSEETERSSLPPTRLSLGTALLVLGGITLSLAFLLFSPAPPAFPRISFTLPSSASVIGLAGVGSGIVLWIILSSLFKQYQANIAPQKQVMARGTTPPFLYERPTLAPEPIGSQAKKPPSWEHDPQAGGWWTPFTWERELCKMTNKRAIYQMRQRLRLLRLYYADEVASARQVQRYWVKKRNGRMIFQRKPQRSRTRFFYRLFPHAL